MTLTQRLRANGKKSKSPAKLSRQKKPANLSLEEWQIELRKQFGREQKYKIVNRGDDPIYSEFDVTNPESKNTYRVLIRGIDVGDNHCTCADFATNALGTCKHIEFALAKIEKQRGGKASLRAGHQPSYSEVYLHYGAQREARFRPGTDCSTALSRLALKYFTSDGVLREDAFSHFEDFLDKARAIDPDLRCRDDAVNFIAGVRDSIARQERINKAFARGIKSAALNTVVQANLYDYQREGALFVARAGRALIGDEMGLGKTIQAIAAAEIMAAHQGVERVLIVCPTSLKHQWKREIERFTKRTANVVGGLRPSREAAFAENTFFKITNYDTVHRDLDLIESWSPDFVVLDEAQRIKNWKTRTAQSVKKITSPYALVLTGTPLENRLEELVSIVQFVDKHRLGPTYRFLHDHQVTDEHGRVVGYRNLNRIGETLAPILLRRKKADVLEQLPERIDKNFFVAMTPKQRMYHADNHETVVRVVAKWKRFGFLTEEDQRRLMIALQNMRMSCDSSYLLDQSEDHGVKADEIATLLDEILEEPNTKVVVFSQWLRMHELIERRIKDRPWNHVLFHGGIDGRKRGSLIDRFCDDPKCRVFLSTDAGGVGLNLQFASVVVNMDLPWNPAVLEQRIGRVHRLGQKQPVRVVNFVSQGTIEHGMLSVLKFKKSMFAGALDRGESEVFLGGTRLKRFLETVDKATTAIPVEEREEAEEPRTSPRRQAAKDQRSPGEVKIARDPLSELLETGLTFFKQLTKTNVPERNGVAALASLVERDDRTGEQFLRVKMPEPEIIDGALQALGTFLKSLQR